MLLITKLNINEILAGILTQTALYSVNLRIMHQTPNISLFNHKTIFSSTTQFEPYDKLLIIGVIVIVITVLLNYFLKTQMGLALRACGDNEAMVRASSIDTDKMKIIGLGLANGLVALSGALFTQQQGYADITSGIGLTFIKSDKVAICLVGTIVGAIFYRFALTIALYLGLPSGDLKILSAFIVVIAISSATLKRRFKKNA